MSSQSSFIKFLQVVLVFLYMEILLWSALLHPNVDVDVRWVPKSFFSSERLTTCFIRMHYSSMVAMETTFFTLLAMFGYFYGVGSVSSAYREAFGYTLANFEQAMMGISQKYYWICFVPWIITFSQNWLQNVGDLLIMFSSNAIEAHNMYSALCCLLVFYAVQALLASEVVYMALNGWCAMNNINTENVEWEKRKRHFGGDTLDTVFGKVD